MPATGTLKAHERARTTLTGLCMPEFRNIRQVSGILTQKYFLQNTAYFTKPYIRYGLYKSVI